MPEIPLRDIYTISEPLTDIGLSRSAISAIDDATVPADAILVDQLVRLPDADYRLLMRRVRGVSKSPEEAEPMRRRAPMVQGSNRHRIMRYLSRHGASDAVAIRIAVGLSRRQIIDELYTLTKRTGWLARINDGDRKKWHVTAAGREALRLTDRQAAGREGR